MNTNCKNCDRADCPTLTGASLVMHAGAQNRALADCAAHTVDWRTRYFTAEARATAAEAELAKLRAYMPKWRKDSAGGFTLGFSVTTLASVIDSRGLWFATVMHRRVDEPLPARDEAMRAVEKVLRLPVCEVLP